MPAAPRPRRRSLRLLPLLLATACGVALSGCGSSKPAHTTASLTAAQCSAATGGVYTLVAKSTRWNTACITLSGTSITFTIRNDDRGILHNLNVMKAPGTAKTDLVPGPATQTLALKGLTPGTTYTYVCDLHANMIGELRVAK